MSELKILHYVVGPVETNCYICVNTPTKEALIIDPGASPGKLAERIRREEVTPKAILLTHGHFDHVDGARALADEFGISIYAHEYERQVLEDQEKNVSWMMGEKKTYTADVYLRDQQELELAGFKIRVLLTPGHTAGGCCYYLPYEDVLFSGDTLFAQSVGRTDFPTGSMSDIARSIKEKLMTLPENTTVYTGHGEPTTIETERIYNPYL